MEKLFGVTRVLTKWMDAVAGTALVLIMVLVSLDVVLRYFRMPIIGTYDIVLWTSAFVMGFALPRTSWDKGHVSVDILVERIVGARKALDIVTRLIGIGFFLILAYNFITMAIHYVDTGDSTMTISLPLYPLALVLGSCSLAESFVLVSDMLRVVCKRGDYE